MINSVPVRLHAHDETSPGEDRKSWAGWNFQRKYLEKRNTDRICINTQSIDKDFLIIKYQGWGFLGLSRGRAGPFPLSDQVVQWGHRSDGEMFIKQTTFDFNTLKV